MKNNYLVYHLHTDYSSCVTNIDSVTKVDMYVEKAKECGMTALAFSEHGNIFNWYEKKTKIEAAGMKYIHATEAYLTETYQDKINDNYHCVLIAKNYDGFKELNSLVSMSFERENNHFYYRPRISFDKLFETSDNIIVTSACLASVLNEGSEELKSKFINWMSEHQDRCFLEIQHHNVDSQIEYNKYLLDLHKKTGIRLVAGTDTHSLNETLAEARVILQRSKNTYFSNEDGWDLTFKTYDELIDAYKKQNAIPMEYVLEAINNTNIIEDMVEPFEVDMSIKYPKLYDNPEEEFHKKIYDALERHPYALKNHTREDLEKRIEEEFSVFKETGMIDFLLFQTWIREWEHENNIYTGPARGSISGSMIAYILGITDMDSMRFGLNFFRFAHKYRVSNAD